MRKLAVAVLVMVSLALAMGVCAAFRLGLVEKAIHVRWILPAGGIALLLSGFCFWWFAGSPSLAANRRIVLSVALGQVILGFVMLVAGLYPASWVLVALILVAFFLSQGLVLLAALRARARRAG